ARLATGIELSIHSAISRAQSIDSLPIGWIVGDDLLHGRGLWFNILWAVKKVEEVGWASNTSVNIPVLPLNESNLPKDVIYSLSLSIYGKWNSDFRTISYKRMEIHHFAMKTT
ncbi:hypothetical protein ACJX0J_004511, partial [Zea mays]